MDAYLNFMTSVMRFWMNWVDSVMRFGREGSFPTDTRLGGNRTTQINCPICLDRFRNLQCRPRSPHGTPARRVLFALHLAWVRGHQRAVAAVNTSCVPVSVLNVSHRRRVSRRQNAVELGPRTKFVVFFAVAIGTP